MDGSLNAQSLTCSARTRLQAGTVLQADGGPSGNLEGSIALHGDTVPQAWGQCRMKPLL